jgi:three-Cys-motif partner protein
MVEEIDILKESRSDWGGPWTEQKLNTFSRYVRAYLTIMKKRPYWQTIYFDGFAGSGNRKEDCNSMLFKQLKISDEEEHIYRGSAERVLTLGKDFDFDFYYFIDTNKSSLSTLEKKLETIPGISEKIVSYKHGDCNKYIFELAKALHTNKYAALVLLDPFGMQINWDAVASLSNTRSDLWILVPTGLIVNRLLDRNGELTHIDKLQSFLGLSEEEIRSAFYNQCIEKTLFGDEKVTTKILKPIDNIARLYIRQLKTVWKYVSENPLILKNSRGVALFHFIFATNNLSALKIASQIIKSR